MADPKLTIVIEQKGADGVVKQLKEIEKVGNTTFTRITKDGKLVSETMKTMTGAAKTNWQAITALSTSYTALASAIQPVVRWLGEAAQAAFDDEASQVRRNAALKYAIGYTEDLTDRLNRQADAYSRIYGVSDDYTREIQTQWAAQGANADSIERLTNLSIHMAEVMGTDATTAVVRLAKAFSGQTDTVKGTRLEFTDTQKTLERVAIAEEYVASGTDMLTDKMGTGKGAVDRYKVASDELKEAFGGLANTDAAVTGINAITTAIFGLTDLINGNLGNLGKFGGILGGLAGGLPGAGMGAAVGSYYEGKQGGAMQGVFGDMGSILAGVRFNGKNDDKTGRKGGGKRSPIGPKFDFLLFTMPTIQDLLDLQTQKAIDLANFIAGSSDTTGWGSAIAAANSIKGTALRAGRVRDIDPSGTISGMFGANGWGNSPFLAAQQNMARNKALIAAGQISGRAQQPFDQPAAWGGSALTSVIMPLLQGNFAGAGSAAGGILGANATEKMGGLLGSLGGPLGGLLGGWIGGGLGKLFGGGHKKRQGETPGQPVYVEDVRMNNQLTDFLNSTKLLMLRGAGQGIDNGVRQVGLQNARAGM